jgi:hypothetical protein
VKTVHGKYKTTQNKFSMFQNAFIGNVAINMNEGRDALVFWECICLICN